MIFIKHKYHMTEKEEQMYHVTILRLIYGDDETREILGYFKTHSKSKEEVLQKLKECYQRVIFQYHIDYKPLETFATDDGIMEKYELKLMGKI